MKPSSPNPAPAPNSNLSPSQPEDLLLFNGCYQAKKKISAGSFGTVYTG